MSALIFIIVNVKLQFNLSSIFIRFLFHNANKPCIYLYCAKFHKLTFFTFCKSFLMFLACSYSLDIYTLKLDAKFFLGVFLGFFKSYKNCFSPWTYGAIPVASFPQGASLPLRQQASPLAPPCSPYAIRLCAVERLRLRVDVFSLFNINIYTIYTNFIEACYNAVLLCFSFERSIYALP